MYNKMKTKMKDVVYDMLQKVVLYLVFLLEKYKFSA